MKIVYLDQNIASRLAVASDGSKWERIRNLLQQGFASKIYICPMPFETLIESASCYQEKQNAIAHFFKEVSGGVSFKHFTTLVAESTIALVRDNYPTTPYTVLTQNWSDDEQATSCVADEHIKMKARLTARQDQFIPETDSQIESLPAILQGVEEQRCGMFYRDLEKMELDSTFPLDDFEVPWLVEALLSSKITTHEISNLKEKVCHHHWTNIPENYADMLLGSIWGRELSIRPRTKYKPNDEIDRRRASVALVHADVFVTDGGWAELCTRSEVFEFSSCKIFSIKQSAEFEAWCKNELSEHSIKS